MTISTLHAGLASGHTHRMTLSARNVLSSMTSGRKITSWAAASNSVGTGLSILVCTRSLRSMSSDWT